MTTVTGPAAEPRGAAGDTMREARTIADWLIAEAPRLDVAAMIDGLGWRLRAAGVPLDRFTVSVRLLSPSVVAATIDWRPFHPLGFRRYDYAERDKGLYERSPFRVVHETGEWLSLDLRRTPDDSFGIVPELKAAGFLHYVAVPVTFSGGDPNNATFATREERGFSAADRALLAEILPAMTNALEIKTLQRSLREVLATYVGAEPASRIVAGTTHRGEVTALEAAILVADLRGFTFLSTQMPPEATANLLNAYYDVVVPPIAEAGGEVLKFIGDAVLAIFPAATAGAEAAVAGAFRAARAALATPVAPVPVNGGSHQVEFGVALHLGEVVYGNVGSGDRLDFTVVGRDVNVAARISSLCSRLGRPFLLSRPFAAAAAAGSDLADGPERRFVSLGRHDVRGLAEPLEVLAPSFGPGAVDRPASPDDVSVGPVLM